MVRARTLSLVVAGFALLMLAGPSAQAQQPGSSPTPKELWEAYPLEPGQTSPTATPSEAATEGSASASASATPRGTAGDRDGGGGGLPLAVPLGLVVLAAIGAGVILARRRRSDAGPVDAEGRLADAPAPRRFEWREYPEPARPAPPPPPVPGAPSTLKDALRDQREAVNSRSNQREHH